MNAKRLLSALGGSYQERLTPYVEGISPRSTVAWAIRDTIPERHQAAAIQALEAHAREVLSTLSEARGETLGETLERIAQEGG